MRVVTSAAALLALIFGVQVATAQGNDVSNASPTVQSISVPHTVTVAHTVAPKVRPKPKPKVKPKPKKAQVVFIKGVLPSAYRGKYYDARYEAYRRCVVKRESEGEYYVVDPSGAAGAYQFMPAWTHTLQVWNHHFVPIQKMTRYEQDYAFWRAFDHGKGASAWSGGRWYCGF